MDFKGATEEMKKLYPGMNPDVRNITVNFIRGGLAYRVTEKSLETGTILREDLYAQGIDPKRRFQEVTDPETKKKILEDFRF